MKRTSESLFWPFLVISVGFIASMAFVIYALLNYKKPTPLVIKPSSVSTIDKIGESFQKALFPLTQQKEHFKVLGEDDFSAKLQQSLNTFFKPTEKKALNVVIQKMDLSKKESRRLESSCEKLSLFHLKRKKERVWDKAFIFTLCRESDESYLLVYDKSLEN